MRIPEPMLQQVLRRHISIADNIVWNRFTSFEWESLRDSPAVSELTEAQLKAVRTALLIEDHLPGFATELMHVYALDPDEDHHEIWLRRQVLHYIFLWCRDEDRHAQTLELYLRSTSRVDGNELTEEMVREGIKPYHAPSYDQTQLYTYTMMQEKATQLFYQALGAAVNEPILKALLTKLSQDEARHCAFYADLVKVDLITNGSGIVPLLHEAIENFRMPLYGVLDNYKQQAYNMQRQARGYDHRVAFDMLRKLIDRYARVGAGSTSSPMEDFYNEMAAFQPTQAIV